MTKEKKAFEAIKPHFEIVDGEDGECWGTGEYDHEEELNTLEKAIDELEELRYAMRDLICSHFEFVIDHVKSCAYFRIKGSKGREKSFTSWSFIDYWKKYFVPKEIHYGK